METLIFDVMLNGRFIKTMKYRYCSAAPIEEEDIAASSPIDCLH